MVLEQLNTASFFFFKFLPLWYCCTIFRYNSLSQFKTKPKHISQCVEDTGNLSLLAVDLKPYLVTCQSRSPWLAHFTSTLATFSAAFPMKWRNVMQRLSEVCSAAASKNIQLIGNFVTKVRSLSLPPSASFLTNGTADLDGANVVVFTLPNQEEVECDFICKYPHTGATIWSSLTCLFFFLKHWYPVAVDTVQPVFIWSCLLRALCVPSSCVS